MILGLAWVLLDETGQLNLSRIKILQARSTTLTSLETIQDVAEINKSLRVPASLNCTSACIKVKSKALGQEFMIDSGDDAIRFDLLEQDVLELSLVNSREFDSVVTYGAQLADFSDQKVFIDWTARDVQALELSTEQLKYLFYKTTWRSFDSKKTLSAVFAVDAKLMKPPEFILHHQKAGSGIQQLHLSQTFKKGEKGMLTANEPLVLSRNSMLGYEFKNFDQNIKSCQYFAPNGSEEDCMGWFKAQVIRSISEQDIGTHRIDLRTNQWQSEYQFKILGLK